MTLLRPPQRHRFDLFVGGSRLSKVVAWLRDGVPHSIRNWIAGPTGTIRLGAGGHEVAGHLGRARPVRAIIGQDLMLRRIVTLPRSGRRDIHHAIALLVRTQTAFAPDEVFGRIDPVESSQSEQGSYQLILVPWWPVHDALRTLRVRQSALREILIEGTDGRLSRVGPLRTPVQRLGSVLAALAPLVVVLVSAAMVVSSEQAARLAAVTDLQKSVAVERDRLRALASEQEAYESSRKRSLIVEDALTGELPVGRLIDILGRTLPDGAEASRLEIREGTLRLGVRVANALEVTKALGHQLPGWSVAIDGTIMAAGGAEQATIAISRGSR